MSGQLPDLDLLSLSNSAKLDGQLMGNSIQAGRRWGNNRMLERRSRGRTATTPKPGIYL